MTSMPSRSRRKGLLRVHAWLIVTATAVTLGSAAAVAMTRPASYVATAQVAVAPEESGGSALRPEMASEREIASSGTVTSRAARTLGADPAEVDDGLSVSAVIESSILNIRYAAATPVAASEGARAFAQGYVDYRNGMTGTRMARVVTWPDTVERTGVNLPLVLAVALVAGLMLGVGAAWAWDRIADRIRHPDELADLSGLPLLGEVPRWRANEQLAPPGPTREAFAHLAARVGALVSQRHADLRIVVTSPRRGAGTTTIAVNTALALAARQHEVVLVGADLLVPGAHDALDVPGAPGLIEVLDGTCSLESAVRRTHRQNLSVLPVGEPPNPEEVCLEPDLLGRVLHKLSTRAIVVVDAPPILESAGSVVLADKADVLLLVGDIRSGKRKDVEDATRLIDGIGPAVRGWVSNLPRRDRRRPPETPVAGPRAVPEPPRTSVGESDRVAS